MELQTARGMKDIPPEELIIRNKLVNELIKIFESYGFNPLETPMVERLDILNAKFGAGSDSDVAKEIFRMKDQGERDLGLRFELTLSMCRYVAMNPNLKMPFKRYEIGRVYRDGPIKLGRSREFVQCDVDIVGARNMVADAECLILALDAFEALGLDAYLEVNNRKLLNGILEYAGVPETKRKSCMIVIDKLKKIGAKAVASELQGIGIKDSSIEKLLTLFSVLRLDGDLFENVDEFKKLVKSPEGIKGIEELDDLFSYLSYEQRNKVKFNPFLARGLSYYTGTVFEGYMTKSDMTSSICGGGRYDEMIKMLMNSKEDVPAVGISFGLVPIMEALKLKGTDSKKTVTNLFVIPIGKTFSDSLSVASRLRKQGLNVEVDLMSRPISKNLVYASYYAIPFVLFVGENELKDGKLKLRNMVSGQESLVSLKNVEKEIKKIIK